MKKTGKTICIQDPYDAVCVFVQSEYFDWKRPYVDGEILRRVERLLHSLDIAAFRLFCNLHFHLYPSEQPFA